MNAQSGDRVPKVLIVDDNPAIREFLAEVLTSWGPFEVNPCDVDHASGVVEALKLLSSNDFDLVLLDMIMPDGNGLQILEAMKDRESSPTIIILSADDPPDLRKKCMEMGAVAFLRKGDGVETLVREVMTQLETPPASISRQGDDFDEKDRCMEDTGPGRILIVDDDPLVCDALASMMNLFDNVEVKTANGGRTGLELAKEWYPHVVLLDIAMPDMDGRQTLQGLTEAGLKPRVIMVSAFRDSEVAQKCVELGAVDYIPKPVDFMFLKRAVAGHLTLAKQEAAAEGDSPR